METPETTHTFDQAFVMIKDGVPMARLGWNGKGLSVRLQRPDENSKMSKPYFYITAHADGEKDAVVPWIPSQTDLMGEDWVVYQEL